MRLADRRIDDRMEIHGMIMSVARVTRQTAALEYRIVCYIPFPYLSSDVQVEGSRAESFPLILRLTLSNNRLPPADPQASSRELGICTRR